MVNVKKYLTQNLHLLSPMCYDIYVKRNGGTCALQVRNSAIRVQISCGKGTVFLNNTRSTELWIL